MHFQRKRKSQIIAFFCCILFFISTTALHSMAYNVKNTQINPYRPVSFIPYSGFSSNMVSYMEDSVNQWNDAAGVSLMSISSSRHDETFGFASKDGENHIYFIDAGTEYAAITAIWDTSGVVTEVDININAYYSWVDGAQRNCIDFYSVFLHETGHAMGLADVRDVSYRDVVMYYLIKDNTTKRTLAQDDKDGIQEIYGWLTN